MKKPIATFLEASRRGDRAALLATFAGDAVLTDQETDYRGAEIAAWNDRQFLGAQAALDLLGVTYRNDETTLTAEVSGHFESFGVTEPSRLHFTFLADGERITRLTITEVAKPSLPPPVSTFFEAMMDADCEALVSAFAPDALVNDIQRDFWGREVIRRWAAREIFHFQVAADILRTVEHFGDFIVTAKLDGTYDKTACPIPSCSIFTSPSATARSPGSSSSRIARPTFLEAAPTVLRG